MQFTAPSTDSYGNPIDSWSWNFEDGDGDSSFSESQNPIHTFTTPGTYYPVLDAYEEDTEITGYGPPISVAAYSGLVFNGGFETGDLTGWTMGGDTNGLDVEGDFAYSGNYGLCFGGQWYPAFISQTIPTTPGATYLLSFWLDSPDGDTPNQFLLTWNGTTLMNSMNLPAFGWTNLQFVVRATGSSTVLEFGGEDPNSCLSLDQVDLESNFVKFAAVPSVGSVPLTVHFTSPATNNLGIAITRWNWDFGDGGGTSTSQNPVSYFIPPRMLFHRALPEWIVTAAP